MAIASTLMVLFAGTAPAGAVPLPGAQTAEGPPVAAPPEAGGRALSAEQALAQARRTGVVVQVEGATTPTSTLAANPDGTFTQTQTVAPTRKLVAGSWKGLDPTLHANPDGSLSPAVTSSAVTLSGGGAGPLATMQSFGKSLAVTLPMTLPAPTLSGPTATYPAVLPGVDLQVRVDAQGGMSQVFVVQDAAAAANPALKTLTLTTRTSGVTMSSDAAGNIAAKDPSGRATFTAPPPLMWDSAAPAASVPVTTDAKSGLRVDARTGDPVASTTDGPGEGAHVARLSAKASATAITLTPDPAVLTGPGTVYPVYIDPTFTAPGIGSTQNSWAYVWSAWPGDAHYKENDVLRVGYQGWQTPYYTARSFLNVSVPSQIHGATVLDSQLNILLAYSPSCTAKPVQLWNTGPIGAGTTWNNQPAWNAIVGTAQNVAYGYSSACPAANVGFNTTSIMQSAATSRWTNLTFGLRASNESDAYGWKKFSNSIASLTTHYDHPPNTPAAASLTTSPTTSCTSGTSTVGDNDVTLTAQITDPDGGLLGATISAWNTTTGALIGANTDPNTTTTSSGGRVNRKLDRATLDALAAGATVRVSWRVLVTDYHFNSAWSPTCTFTFDQTRPGAPTIPTLSQGQIGVPLTLAITPAPGTTPTSYIYQVNGGAPATTTAASVTITPTRGTNVVTVSAVSAGGNIGDPGTGMVIATAATTAVDGDLSGDGLPDLTTAGGPGTGLPSGLWQATGRTGTAPGQVTTNAIDIGSYGTGTDYTGAPTDFDHQQALTGHFHGGGLQDVLAYNPAGGNATILDGNGDGSVLPTPSAATQQSIDSLTDPNNSNPLRLAAATNLQANALAPAYPDLIAISGTTGSYYLVAYPTNGYEGQYVSDGMSGSGFVLTSPPPAAGTWDQWTITSTQLSAGTALYLWNSTTGALYLWTNLYLNPTTGALDHTQYAIAANWRTGATLTLQAGDFNADATPDLWAIGAGGAVTAYTLTGLTATPTLTAQAGQTLSTSTHTWALADATTGTLTSAADTVGTSNATPPTGVAGPTANTGDLFSPDAIFTTSPPTALATTGSALTTNSDYSISAWVKTTTTGSGGVVVSQVGTATAGFKVWAETSNKSWRFAIPSSDTANPTWYTAAAPTGSVRPGLWTHLLATYKQSNGQLKLYINGVNAANATHVAAAGFTGPFQIGRTRTSATAYGTYFDGHIAQIQTWNQVLDPVQDQSPAGYYQPLAPQTRFLDTRTGLGTGGVTGPLANDATIHLAIAGTTIGAVTIPATNVTAVAINLTAVPTAGATGYVTTYPDNTPQPATSNLNYTTGTVIANYVIVPVGNNGKINLYLHGSPANLLADVSGYFTTNAAATGNTTYTPLTPTRFLDTRTGTGAPKAKIIAGGTAVLQIGGVKGVPTGVRAVAINITTTNSTAASYLINYPDGTTRPTVSGLQFPGASAISNMAIVPVAANGKIDIYNYAGSTDIVGDVVGYFTTGTTGQKYHAIAFTRMIDTRTDGGAIGAGNTLHFSQGNTVIAANPTLIINATAVAPTSIGYITIYANGTTTPTTSNINFTVGQTIPNLALPTTGTNGTIDALNQSSSVQLVIDCFGYLATA